jgi:hypothetical protein
MPCFGAGVPQAECLLLLAAGALQVQNVVEMPEHDHMSLMDASR